MGPITKTTAKAQAEDVQNARLTLEKDFINIRNEKTGIRPGYTMTHIHRPLIILVEDIAALNEKLKPLNGGKDVIPITGTDTQAKMYSINRWLGQDPTAAWGLDTVDKLDFKVHLILSEWTTGYETKAMVAAVPTAAPAAAPAVVAAAQPAAAQPATAVSAPPAEKPGISESKRQEASASQNQQQFIEILGQRAIDIGNAALSLNIAQNLPPGPLSSKVEADLKTRVGLVSKYMQKNKGALDFSYISDVYQHISIYTEAVGQLIGIYAFYNAKMNQSNLSAAEIASLRKEFMRQYEEAAKTLLDPKHPLSERYTPAIKEQLRSEYGIAIGRPNVSLEEAMNALNTNKQWKYEVVVRMLFVQLQSLELKPTEQGAKLADLWASRVYYDRGYLNYQMLTYTDSDHRLADATFDINDAVATVRRTGQAEDALLKPRLAKIKEWMIVGSTLDALAKDPKQRTQAENELVKNADSVLKYSWIKNPTWIKDPRKPLQLTAALEKAEKDYDDTDKAVMKDALSIIRDLWANDQNRINQNRINQLSAALVKAAGDRTKQEKTLVREARVAVMTSINDQKNLLADAYVDMAVVITAMAASTLVLKTPELWNASFNSNSPEIEHARRILDAAAQEFDNSIGDAHVPPLIYPQLARSIGDVTMSILLPPALAAWDGPSRLQIITDFEATQENYRNLKDLTDENAVWSAKNQDRDTSLQEARASAGRQIAVLQALKAVPKFGITPAEKAFYKSPGLNGLLFTLDPRVSMTAADTISEIMNRRVTFDRSDFADAYVNTNTNPSEEPNIIQIPRENSAFLRAGVFAQELDRQTNLNKDVNVSKLLRQLEVAPDKIEIRAGHETEDTMRRNGMIKVARKYGLPVDQPFISSLRDRAREVASDSNLPVAEQQRELNKLFLALLDARAVELEARLSGNRSKDGVALSSLSTSKDPRHFAIERAQQELKQVRELRGWFVDKDGNPNSFNNFKNRVSPKQVIMKLENAIESLSDTESLGNAPRSNLDDIEYTAPNVVFTAVPQQGAMVLNDGEWELNADPIYMPIKIKDQDGERFEEVRTIPWTAKNVMTTDSTGKTLTEAAYEQKNKVSVNLRYGYVVFQTMGPTDENGKEIEYVSSPRYLDTRGEPNKPEVVGVVLRNAYVEGIKGPVDVIVKAKPSDGSIDQTHPYYPIQPRTEKIKQENVLGQLEKGTCNIIKNHFLKDHEDEIMTMRMTSNAPVLVPTYGRRSPTVIVIPTVVSEVPKK